jgi:PAS domain S-box-containing protein
MNEEEYKSIIENAKDGVVVVQNNVVLYANQYISEVTGIKKEEIVGKLFSNIIKKDEESEKTKEDFSTYEIVFQNKDGKHFIGEVHEQKIQYQGEESEILFIRDITTRKKTEEVFLLQEERFHGVAENTPDIITRFDREYRYVYINKAGEKAFGISKKDIFWKSDEDLGINDDRTRAFKEAVDYVFEKKERNTFYNELLINGERKYYYTILLPEFFKDGEVNSVLSITRDITEIREIDQIKTDFISITSHQLRSPLSVINWCIISLLNKESVNSKEEEEEYLQRIDDSTRKLIKITDVFLNTTLLDLEMFVFNFKEIDLTSIVNETVREFDYLVEKRKIKLNVIVDDFSLVKFDKRVLKIIFRGLLSNAVEYTPENGNIDFLLKRVGKEAISFEVGDSGCGILPEEKKKIFTKFYRSDSAKNMRAYGTGLDLYLIKSILGKIGGSIEVNSPNLKYGKGTIFSVKIPLRNEEKSIL